MFFMTCGIIKQIQSRKSLFGQTSALPYFKSTSTYTSDMNDWLKIQLRHYEKPVILKIVDIQHFQNEQFNILTLNIFDGEGSTEAILDKSMWDRVDQKHFKTPLFNKNIHNNNLENYVDVDSVIILTEYTFESLILDNPLDENTNRALIRCRDLIKILNFSIIGIDKNTMNNSVQSIESDDIEIDDLENLNLENRAIPIMSANELMPPPPIPPTIKTDNDTIINITTNNQNINNLNSKLNSTNINDNSSSSSILSKEHRTMTLPIPTHSISFLSKQSILTKNNTWCIEAKLTKMTPVREFTNRITSNQGKVQRLQFTDNTGCIEAMAFDQQINSHTQALQIGYNYLVSNFELKKAKSTCQAWYEDKPVQVDIAVLSHTKIQLNNQKSILTNNDVSIEDVDLAEISNDSNDSNMIEPCPAVKLNIIDDRKNNFASENNKINEDEEKKNDFSFKKLDQLKLLKCDTFVNVFGVVRLIQEMSTCRPKDKSPIKLRRITVCDETTNKMSVALWGKEAEEFNLTIGAVIMFKNIKITDFGGVSLSVMRDTKCVEMLPFFDIEPANYLIKWWSQQVE